MKLSIPRDPYEMVASMAAAILNSQCIQMQNCEGGCETINCNLNQSNQQHLHP